MAGNKKDHDGEDLSGFGRRSLYDTSPQDPGSEWFLPGPSAEVEDFAPPLPRNTSQPLFDPEVWHKAQNSLSDGLARLAAAFGALDERMRAGPDGWRHRLALLEADGLGWWSGTRVGAERLSLWVGLRMAGPQEDNQALAQAAWAVRRLTGGPGPWQDGWAHGTALFLGRQPQPGDPAGFAGVELAEVMDEAASLHPVTQSAILFHAWRIIGHERPRDVEAAVMAARNAARMGRGGASFVPLAISGFTGLRAAGLPEARLKAWITGAEMATLAALLHLDRLSDWCRRAEAGTADLSGRTPRALITVLRDWPQVSAPLAEAVTGASRAAVQRNLDKMQARGLIREVTGQSRYRVWSAQH